MAPPQSAALMEPALYLRSLRDSTALGAYVRDRTLYLHSLVPRRIWQLQEDSMKRASRQPTTPANLPASTQQRLNSYALVAGAAGVSALALALPAQARIIYTPAHRVVKQGEHYRLDVNHDGITDFTVNDVFHSTSSGFYATLSASPAAGNGLEGWTGIRGWAFALKPGAAIGPRHYFPAQVLVRANSLAGSLTYAGSWVNVKNRYAGLRFKIAGKIHYGWARFSVQVTNRSFITATLSGYAYETIPSKPIIAGKTKGSDVVTISPASLGHLAAGASAIPAWRSGR